ncbi:MAG: proton-conducting transporter membrane subunit [Bacteroidota bacterium]
MASITVLYHAVNNLSSVPWILPELIVVALIVAVIIGAALPPNSSRWWIGILVPLGLFAALLSTLWGTPDAGTKTRALFNGLLVWTPLVTFFRSFFTSATGLTLFMMRLQERPIVLVRWAFVLSVLLGANLLAMAAHWLVVYLSLGLLSLAVALLIYGPDTAARAVASLQYLLHSTIVLAIMLWGLSFLYGFGHDLNVSAWSSVATHQAASPLWGYAGVLVLLSGVLFVSALFPFHFWVPDAYTVVPPWALAYLATVPKLAGIAFLMRLCAQIPLLAYGDGTAHVQHFLALLALMTIAIGNVGALLQKDVCRMMAYASVAQGGILVAGVVALPKDHAGVLYYGLAYGMGSFAALMGIQILSQLTGQKQILGYAGLGRRFPVFGVSLTVAMVSLVGLPPTAGFVGKFLILQMLWEGAMRGQGLVLGSLLAASLLSTLPALYYYLKIPYVMFLQPHSMPFEAKLSTSDKIVRGLVVILAIALVGMVGGIRWCLALLGSQ